MSWSETQEKLSEAAQRQLFFVGGAPRSGTTWLQHMLDAHPDISCKGEALFMQQMATPLDRLFTARNEEISSKNNNLFRHSGGYPLSPYEDNDQMLGTGILMALSRQLAEKPCTALGEKTPENVFLFPRLKRIFPTAKFIGIARDPRDVMTSSWHFFQKSAGGRDETEAKLGFVKVALPALKAGMRMILDLPVQFPVSATMVTYERLRTNTEASLATLYRFLGVDDSPDLVADCVRRTSFAALSGGRQAGDGRDGSFFRKGVIGDWQNTLPPVVNQYLLDELQSMFADYGWQP